jgi:conjugal transfer pilus assembly protein TraW
MDYDRIRARMKQGIDIRIAYALLLALVLILTLLFTVLSAAAVPGDTDADLGVIGSVYPIREHDLLEWVTSRLTAMQRSGELQQMQKEALERARKSIERPAPVPGITRTSRPRVFHIDPALSVEHAIRDAKGRIIAMPGTRVNPFDYMMMSKHLLFINGDDADQVEWAAAMDERYGGHVKTILVAGAPIELMKQWKRRVYFDQHGVLTHRFHIRHVPAIVSQDKQQLRVAEVLPGKPAVR